ADEPLTINQRTLEQRLHERGLLASVDKKRGRLRVRVSGLEGKRRPVLHLLATSIFPEAPRPPVMQANDNLPPEAGLGRKAGPVLPPQQQEPAQENGSQKAEFEFGGDGAGPVGPIGPV